MPVPEKPGTFYLGKLFDAATGQVTNNPLFYNSKDLTTHAVCVGMTGSGKTGLGIALIEEAGLDSIPSIVIDPKGDMANILLTFPDLSAEEFAPWIDPGEAERKGESLESYAKEVAHTWAEGLKTWDETPKRIQDLKAAVSMEIYTPASRAGIPLSILNSFQAPSKEFLLDVDAMRERVASTTSSLLTLLGINADPIKSREHILISTIIDHTWREGKDVTLAGLIQQIQKPPFDKIGALDKDTFFPQKERMALSVTLNNLLASPGFQAWMEGVPLDIQQLLYTPSLKPKISIISIAHLPDSERMFFVTLLLNQLISWMRRQPGTSSLRALFYMDEIFGYFPPTAAPPSKMPMITLLKQARAFGLGLVLATQNPVDLDYKGLSNCGTWFIGRLQTARDKMRVVEGLAAASNGEIDAKAMDKLIGEIGNRTFIMRSIYETQAKMFQTRWTLSYLRGPLTLKQIELLTSQCKKDFKETDTKTETTKATNTANKAIVPSGISEYFVSSDQHPSTVCYQPLLAGFSKLHFIDKKANVDDWVNSILVVAPDENGKINWENAKSYPDLKAKLSKTQDLQATYTEAPSEILQEKNYSVYKRDLLAHLYQNNALKIFTCQELKLLSTPTETEVEFRQKVSLALREKRDALVQKLQDQYGKKIAALKDKITIAKGKKEVQHSQSLFQKIMAFLSILATVVASLLGKKITKTTINQAGTTLRRVERIGKESQSESITDENLQSLEKQLQETESQLNDEISKIAAPADASSIPLEEITVRPRKTDIAVDDVALIWWPASNSF